MTLWMRVWCFHIGLCLLWLILGLLGSGLLLELDCYLPKGVISFILWLQALLSVCFLLCWLRVRQAKQWLVVELNHRIRNQLQVIIYSLDTTDKAKIVDAVDTMVRDLKQILK
jgi:hypothetical protein